MSFAETRPDPNTVCVACRHKGHRRHSAASLRSLEIDPVGTSFTGFTSHGDDVLAAIGTLAFPVPMDRILTGRS
jgi:hypothetical protein